MFWQRRGGVVRTLRMADEAFERALDLYVP